MAEEEEQVDLSEYSLVGNISEFSEKKMKSCEVPETAEKQRTIMLVENKGVISAMDGNCYHVGGPLWNGEIEDVPDFGACVICPFHRHAITLESGESIYQEFNAKTMKPGGMKSKGAVQRIHTVHVNGEGEIFVKLQLQEPKLRSDEFAHISYR